MTGSSTWKTKIRKKDHQTWNAKSKSARTHTHTQRGEEMGINGDNKTDPCTQGKTNMTIYNLNDPRLRFELLIFTEACGIDNSEYISTKNLSTMSR